MKYNLLILIIICFFSGCKSQKINDINFKYDRFYYQESVIVESYLYDSATGTYEYKKNNFGLGEDIHITANIKFSRKELKDIYDLYIFLQPKYLSECIFVKNKLLYKSSIFFNKKANKSSTECTSNKKEQEKYDKIEVILLKLIKSSYTYKTTFPEEFIRK